MTYAYYERLTAMDSIFLDIEDSHNPMHIGSVAIFEAEPLLTEAGGLDFERILAFADVALNKNPRFRQKLAFVPGLGTPVWIDDASFNLSYHLRHARLPIPGDERQLKRLAGRIMSQQLDRGKPLWEFWFVEGVEENRFAVISKVHHCLADGISGVDLLSSLMGPKANYTPKATHKWMPRPAPAASRLLVDELRRRARAPLSMLETGAAAITSRGGGGGSSAPGGLRDLLLGLRETFGSGMRPASETPFDVDLGPHRRFDWTRFDLEQVRCIKDHLGGKLNDVALTVVAGAMRRFLGNRGVRVADLEFRAAVPVSVRADSERATLGNRVSMILVPLPLEERDPLERFRIINERTAELKRGHVVGGADTLTKLADSVFPELASLLVRVGLQAHAANLVVTNVPGPPVPVYFQGSRLLANYPVVPLANHMAVGIALLSYAGGLYWGFNSDWDAMPDLHELVEAIDQEFDLLCAAASGGEKKAPPRRGVAARRGAAKRRTAKSTAARRPRR